MAMALRSLSIGVSNTANLTMGVTADFQRQSATNSTGS
jgi:hypothetical protein